MHWAASSSCSSTSITSTCTTRPRGRCSRKPSGTSATDASASSTRSSSPFICCETIRGGIMTRSSRRWTTRRTAAWHCRNRCRSTSCTGRRGPTRTGRFSSGGIFTIGTRHSLRLCALPRRDQPIQCRGQHCKDLEQGLARQAAATECGTSLPDPRRNGCNECRPSGNHQHPPCLPEGLLEPAPPVFGFDPFPRFLQQTVGRLRGDQRPLFRSPCGAYRRTHEAIRSCCHDWCLPSVVFRLPTNHVLISPLPSTSRAPRSSSRNGSTNSCRVLSDTCTRPATPWDSIQLAVFTVSPQTS